jgi:hypothetical protein
MENMILSRFIKSNDLQQNAADTGFCQKLFAGDFIRIYFHTPFDSPL